MLRPLRRRQARGRNVAAVEPAMWHKCVRSLREAASSRDEEQVGPCQDMPIGDDPLVNSGDVRLPGSGGVTVVLDCLGGKMQSGGKLRVVFIEHGVKSPDEACIVRRDKDARQCCWKRGTLSRHLANNGTGRHAEDCPRGGVGKALSVPRCPTRPYVPVMGGESDRVTSTVVQRDQNGLVVASTRPGAPILVRTRRRQNG
mmetsp:Transcript_1821/g.5763  ORF Transcript_1821/g.5763 Transcript_1821/m.5763 type:complete len:200 (-) Transcript_1821:729-1328(-)